MNIRDDKQSGEVAWFDEQRGFGFIQAKGFPHNLFVHIRDVIEAKIPGTKMTKGRKIRFRVGMPARPKGANDKCAVDLELAA